MNKFYYLFFIIFLVFTLPTFSTASHFGIGGTGISISSYNITILDEIKWNANYSDFLLVSNYAYNETLWTVNWSMYNSSWSNRTNLSYLEKSSWDLNYSTNNGPWLNTTNLTYNSYNSTGLIRDWNSSALIINWTPVLSTSYVPYTGATANVDIGNHNLTLNKTFLWSDGVGVRDLWQINDVSGDGFKMQYLYNFEVANDDWLFFNKVDGNDAAPDGGIGFAMTNSTGWNRTIIKLDGYGLANFTDYNITTTGDIKGTNLNVTGNFTAKRPYGMFSDNSVQVLAATSTPYPVNFSTVEDSYLVKKTGSSNFSFAQRGEYLVEISAIFNSTNTNKRVEIWTRKNGANIARSNTVYDFKGVGTNAVVVVPFILEMETTDTFQIMWAGSDTGIQMAAIPATAYSPATPSIIMTITKISDVPV